MPLLEIKNLTTTIDSKIICRDLNLQINNHETWAILGPNGAGKTTLLHTLCNLHAASSGEIIILNKNLNDYSTKQLAQHIGILLQHYETPFPTTVLESISHGRFAYSSFLKPGTIQDNQAITNALQALELDSHKNSCVTQLSGGERRRVDLARLLTQDPDIYLLDEPTNHLDLDRQIQILKCFKQRVETQSKAALLVLHDLNLVERFCDHVLLMFSDGTILTGTTAELLTEENLSKLFYHPLIKINNDSHSAWLPC